MPNQPDCQIPFYDIKRQRTLLEGLYYKDFGTHTKVLEKKKSRFS